MPNDFEEVARFSNPLDARQAFLVLSQNGMQAFIEGENAGSTLWYVGSAIGGVRLLVPLGERPRALELLGDQPTNAIEKNTAWRCGHCFAEVDSGFDVCWRCGKDRSENAQAVIHETTDSELAFFPNAPENDNDNVTADSHPEIEDAVERAWRAAVLGSAILPFLSHAYSLYLLICALPKAPALSSRLQRLMLATLAVDILAAIVFGLVIRNFAAWYFG